MANRQGDRPELLERVIPFLQRLISGPAPQEPPPGPSIGAPSGINAMVPLGFQREMQKFAESEHPLAALLRIGSNLTAGDFDTSPMVGAAKLSGMLKYDDFISDTFKKNNPHIGAIIDKFSPEAVQAWLRPNSQVGITNATQAIEAKKIFDNWVNHKIDSNAVYDQLLKIGVDLNKNNNSLQTIAEFLYDKEGAAKVQQGISGIVDDIMREEGLNKAAQTFMSGSQQWPNTGMGTSIVSDYITPPKVPQQLIIPGERGARAVKQGFTRTAFHGTGAAQDFENKSAFFWGSHFGTEQAANDRLRHLGYISSKDPWNPAAPFESGYLMNESGGRPRFIPVTMRGSESFVGVHDMGAWNFQELMSELLDRNVIDATDYARLSRAIDDNIFRYGSFGNRAPQQQAATKVVGQYLKEKKGVHGLKYINKAEDVGSESYIVFDPVDTRSIFAEFDPEKTNIADLMAGIALMSLGLGGTAAAARQSNRETQKVPR